MLPAACSPQVISQIALLAVDMKGLDLACTVAPSRFDDAVFAVVGIYEECVRVLDPVPWPWAGCLLPPNKPPRRATVVGRWRRRVPGEDRDRGGRVVADPEAVLPKRLAASLLAEQTSNEIAG